MGLKGVYSKWLITGQIGVGVLPIVAAAIAVWGADVNVA